MIRRLSTVQPDEGVLVAVTPGDVRLLCAHLAHPSTIEPTDRLVVAPIFTDSGDGHLRLTIDDHRAGFTYTGDPIVFALSIDHHGVCATCHEPVPCRHSRQRFELDRLTADLETLPTFGDDQ
ncbi:MAG: hypothetical protein R2695_04025 [Acidimicrobiales bacterium]